MKNKPTKVFLQVDSDSEGVKDYSELHQVTFHTEKVFETDLEYISIDKYNELISKGIFVTIDCHVKGEYRFKAGKFGTDNWSEKSYEHPEDAFLAGLQKGFEILKNKLKNN